MGLVAVQVVVVGDPETLFAGAKNYLSQAVSGIVLDPDHARQRMYVLEGHHVLAFISKVIGPLGMCAVRLREMLCQQMPQTDPSGIDAHMSQHWPGAANILQVFSRVRDRPFVKINRFLSDQLTSMEVMRVAIMRNLSGQQSFQGFTMTEAIVAAWKIMGETSALLPTAVPFNVNVPGSATPGGPTPKQVITPIDRAEVRPHIAYMLPCWFDAQQLHTNIPDPATLCFSPSTWCRRTSSRRSR